MYHPYYPYPTYLWHRPAQFPQVDTAVFHQSVAVFQRIAKDSAKILDQLSEQQFAHKIMAAAQTGNHQEVDQLIKSIGVSSTIFTKYTPDGILLTIDADAEGSPCCTLTMYLRWR